MPFDIQRFLKLIYSNVLKYFQNVLTCIHNTKAYPNTTPHFASRDKKHEYVVNTSLLVSKAY